MPLSVHVSLEEYLSHFGIRNIVKQQEMTMAAGRRRDMRIGMWSGEDIDKTTCKMRKQDPPLPVFHGPVIHALSILRSLVSTHRRCTGNLLKYRPAFMFINTPLSSALSLSHSGTFLWTRHALENDQPTLLWE